ncbi:MAG: DUF309 domain-containing protein [Planctomycetaceae bacterium]|nr:DUF309 domain-containing protein [Planctomycetaceae bacterium]
MPLPLVPDVPFPPYTYVPGCAPHPVNDPAGHLYGAAHGPAAALDAEHPEECRAYLRGIDLFNAGYYWEAHEEWESVWHAVGRRGQTADFLKGLIKLAAAGVKAYEGRVEGVRRHCVRAGELLQGAPGQGDLRRFAGVSLARLVSMARTIGGDAEAVMRRGTEAPCGGLIGEIELAPSGR